LIKDVSPISFVSKDDPPIMQVHGDKDVIVPLKHASNLHEKLQSTGVETELVVIPGGNHGVAGAGGRVSKRPIEFVQQYLLISLTLNLSDNSFRWLCEDCVLPVGRNKALRSSGSRVTFGLCRNCEDLFRPTLASLLLIARLCRQRCLATLLIELDRNRPSYCATISLA
jgi:hypothetical protein